MSPWDPAWYAKDVIARAATWDAALERLVSEGATDDEIRQGASWDALTIPERREIETKVAALRGRRLVGETVTAEMVRAKQEELRAADQPHGIDSVAKALHTSPGTVRRRLGRL